MDKFRLVGIMNLFNVVPGFVMPIFENDGKLYFQIGMRETLTTVEFALVKDSAIKNVIMLDKIANNLDIKKKTTISNEPLYAFQISNESVFIGTFEEMKKYLQNFKTDNKILSEEIEDFLNNTTQTI